jgi:hypothetical protein
MEIAKKNEQLYVYCWQTRVDLHCKIVADTYYLQYDKFHSNDITITRSIRRNIMRVFNARNRAQAINVYMLVAQVLGADIALVIARAMPGVRVICSYAEFSTM